MHNRPRGIALLPYLTLAAWALLEVSLRVRERVHGRGSPDKDRGTRILISVTLGSAFRTTVEVDADQAVVSNGPYRRVRHPADSGLLLIFTGFGLALGNWLALAACAVVPLPALLWRIRVEEAELTRVLGDAYRAYQTQTKRLIPGLW